MSSSSKFKETISAEKRDWQQERFPSSYSYRDLMDVGRIVYNNVVCEDVWTASAVEVKTTEEQQEKNFLALINERIDRLERSSGKNPSGTPERGKPGNDGFTRNPGCRYHNPNDEKRKVINGRIMIWCHKDCHKRTMWCGRKVCHSKSEYAAKIKKQDQLNNEGPQRKDKISRDFRIALAALTTTDDLADLEAEFFEVKE